MKYLLSFLLIISQINFSIEATASENSKYYKNLAKSFKQISIHQSRPTKKSLNFFKTGILKYNKQKQEMKIKLLNEKHTIQFKPNENSVVINGDQINLNEMNEFRFNQSLEKGVRHAPITAQIFQKLTNSLFPSAFAGGLRHKHWADLSFFLARASLYSCLLIIPIPIAFPLYFFFDFVAVKLA